MPDLMLAHAVAAMPTEIIVAEESEENSAAVSAIVSAYDVKYRIGFWTHHTIEAGAFDDSIEAQASIPLYKQHDWQDGGAPIGHGAAKDVEKPKKGLRIDGELYVDDAEVKRLPRAAKAGALREWSIGYQVLEYRVDTDDEDHLIVTKAELLEASLVLRGANPETETLEVASRLIGRRPTDDEAELIAAGKPLPTLAGQPAPDPDPEPDPTPTDRPMAAEWVRKLYRPSGS